MTHTTRGMDEMDGLHNQVESEQAQLRSAIDLTGIRLTRFGLELCNEQNRSWDKNGFFFLFLLLI